MDEELFRFVAVRDAQRSARPRILRALTWTPGAESDLVRALLGASPDADAMVAEAEAFRSSSSFVGSIEATPSVVRDVDALLLDRADPGEVVHAVEVALRELSGKATGDLELLLVDPEIVAARERCYDSYLASLFSRTAPEPERSYLDRVVTLWALIENLVLRRTLSASMLDDLLAHAVVVLPHGMEVASPPADPGMPAAAVAPTAGVVPATLQRYTDLRETYAAARSAVVDVLPTIAVSDPASAVSDPTSDLSNLSSTVVTDRLADPVVLTTLQAEGISLAATPLVELPDLLAARANAALVEHFSSVAAAPAETRRAAVVAEMWRRRGVDQPDVPGGGASAGVPARGLGIGRLISAPVIGDLKVVRQTLAGYELGEIAHVENLLAKEELAREHEVVDLTETEAVDVDSTQETHVRDLQTTTRSELSRETSSVMASMDAFNIGGTITASYGPYVSVSATAGYATSNSSTESTATSQRYSRDVTDRATDNITTRSESFRRALNRRTVTEKNTHEMKGPDAENASAVYRWVNKRYCAQVFDYGRRVLLEVGVPDPAVRYRWAAALGGDLDVDVDPPPPLTSPLGGELGPSAIDETNWQALSARFRVADFPPPPRYLVTTPDAYGIEPPSAPTGEGGPAQPITVYKASKELKIPGGYQPLCFFAGVIADGKPMRIRRLPQVDRTLIATLVTGRYASGYGDVPLADVQLVTAAWLDWAGPPAPVPDMTTQDVAVLHGTALTVVQQLVDQGLVPARAWLASIRGFLAAATGRGAVTLLVGTTSVTVAGGVVRTGGVVTAPQVIAGATDTVLPVGYATEPAMAGAVITLEVLSVARTWLRTRWQLEAYNAILAAQASWESDFRAAVAQAEIRGGGAIEGRNPQENGTIVAAELKRAVIAMLGGVNDADLAVVQPGDARADPATGRPTPPNVALDRAAAAARLVQFYEQAFEWQNMSHVLYPYFWTGRDDWPEALRRQDPDPAFRDFLRAGAARIVLPVRRGWERIVGSRLSLRIPAWPNEPKPSTAPIRGGDPFLDIAEEIREAQDMLRGGVPSGTPWPVVLPTTLVAFDGTPMPKYATACDPPTSEEESDG